MDPAHVIETVLQGGAKPGWAVFNYSRIDAVKKIAARALYFVIFGGMAAVFTYTALEQSQTVYFFFGGFFWLIDLILIITIFSTILELINARKQMIVLTDKEVVKSLKGKIETYPYEVIKNLRITNPLAANMPAMMPKREQFVDFTDARTDKFVELVHNRTFGPPELIFNFLNSKLA